MSGKAKRPCLCCGRRIKAHRSLKVCSTACRRTLVIRAKNSEARRRAEKGHGGGFDSTQGHALRTPALALTSRISNSEDDPRQCPAYR